MLRQTLADIIRKKEQGQQPTSQEVQLIFTYLRETIGPTWEDGSYASSKNDAAICESIRTTLPAEWAIIWIEKRGNQQ